MQLIGSCEPWYLFLQLHVPKQCIDENVCMPPLPTYCLALSDTQETHYSPVFLELTSLLPLSINSLYLFHPCELHSLKHWWTLYFYNNYMVGLIFTTDMPCNFLVISTFSGNLFMRLIIRTFLSIYVLVCSKQDNKISLDREGCNNIKAQTVWIFDDGRLLITTESSSKSWTTFK